MATGAAAIDVHAADPVPASVVRDTLALHASLQAVVVCADPTAANRGAAAISGITADLDAMQVTACVELSQLVSVTDTGSVKNRGWVAVHPEWHTELGRTLHALAATFDVPPALAHLCVSVEKASFFHTSGGKPHGNTIGSGAGSTKKVIPIPAPTGSGLEPWRF